MTRDPTFLPRKCSGVCAPTTPATYAPSAVPVRVSFRPEAEADLFELYEYTAARGGIDVAAGYIDRIEAACFGLKTFPLRGRRRDDLGPGLRTIGFERRTTIA